MTEQATATRTARAFHDNFSNSSEPRFAIVKSRTLHQTTQPLFESLNARETQRKKARLPLRSRAFRLVTPQRLFQQLISVSPVYVSLSQGLSVSSTVSQKPVTIDSQSCWHGGWPNAPAQTERVVLRRLATKLGVLQRVLPRRNVDQLGRHPPFFEPANSSFQ